METKKSDRQLTCVASVKENLDRVPSSIPSSQMKRLVQVSHKMNQELEGFICHCIASVFLDPCLQQRGYVLNAVQDIDPWIPSPATGTGEGACLGRVVIQCAYVVQGSGPTHLHSMLIGPGGHRSKMALVRWHFKDATQRWEDTWVQIHLCNCCDYFMACGLLVSIALSDTSSSMGLTCCAPSMSAFQESDTSKRRKGKRC